MQRLVCLSGRLAARVESRLDPVATWVSRLAPGPDDALCAAVVRVVEGAAAPKRRWSQAEYYQRIEWISETVARVEVNGATGQIVWSGAKEEPLEAELAVFPPATPESVGMFLRLVAGLVLAPWGRVLVHASAVVANERVALLLGESGAGKTTTARRLGREGARRIADDIVVVDWANGAPRVEACPFDRAARLPGRLGVSWPLARAFVIEKGAPESRLIGRDVEPFRRWVRSTLCPPLPAEPASRLLEALTSLAVKVPPTRLALQRLGPVLATVLPELG